MNSKFLIFVAVSVILVAASYSLSLSLVSAAKTCAKNTPTGTSWCWEKKGGKYIDTVCVTTGKKKKCFTLSGTTGPSPFMDAAVKALGATTAGGGNNTNVTGGRVIGNATTESNNTSSNANNALQ